MNVRCDDLRTAERSEEFAQKGALGCLLQVSDEAMKHRGELVDLDQDRAKHRRQADDARRLGLGWSKPTTGPKPTSTGLLEQRICGSRHTPIARASFQIDTEGRGCDIGHRRPRWGALYWSKSMRQGVNIEGAALGSSSYCPRSTGISRLSEQEQRRFLTPGLSVFVQESSRLLG